KRSVRYPAGKITTYANIEKSVIKGIKIYGDFFGINDVAELEQYLIGLRYDYLDVLKKLQTIDTTKYFINITPQEIAGAIVE
ncbi:lipoate protein ligase C-terminal domain-containing protein, partial [Streptococcus sp.]|uniref:lipoate protein ligase C-terminal domain-containing protein n=1 Tax=Streptococcus sp. TaxID=1306 RepID=UPI0017E38007